MNITLKDIPEPLHLRLKTEAEASGRSLNRFIIHTLEKAYTSHKVDRMQWLKRNQMRREEMNLWLDDDGLLDAKNSDRA